MIKFIKNGNIFDSQVRVLVNPVNVVGVMGKGLALEFKQRWPHMFEIYKERCLNDCFWIGELLLVKEEDHDILLFPTKRHWRSKAKIEDIEIGLIYFVRDYGKLGIESIAFPMLGCGLGGLAWEDVKPLMVKYLEKLPIEIEIYE